MSLHTHTAQKRKCRCAQQQRVLEGGIAPTRGTYGPTEDGTELLRQLFFFLGGGQLFKGGHFSV